MAYAGASYQTKIDPPTGEFLLNNHTTGGHRMRPQMATTRQYRGYDIVPMRQWSQWCVGIYPTRADLPDSGALDAEQPRLKKGRCGSRSQTEDRPHSRTPELSVRQLICVRRLWWGSACPLMTLSGHPEQGH